jgi:transcriptional regulator with XRE-family HTH domain
MREQWLRLRKLLNINREEIARRTGISKSMIEKFEQGQSDMTITKYEKMISAIGFELIIKMK